MRRTRVHRSRGRELHSDGKRLKTAATVSLVAGKIDEFQTLLLLATRLDCVINSANNHLLTLGVTGIAGAIREVGGPSVQHECDAEKGQSDRRCRCRACGVQAGNPVFPTCK